MSFFFFNDTATTEIYTLSLHDALPISKLPADLLHADDAPLVDEGRVAGDDEEGPEARQGRDDVLDDPVGQIFLLRIPAHVGEREHRDGGAIQQGDRMRLTRGAGAVQPRHEAIHLDGT